MWAMFKTKVIMILVQILLAYGRRVVIYMCVFVLYECCIQLSLITDYGNMHFFVK